MLTLMPAAFGVDRCMFASNFPIDKLLSNYTTLFKGFQEVLKDFSAEDQHKLFYSNGEFHNMLFSLSTNILSF